MIEPKVISFPNSRRIPRPQSSDEKLVADIRKAWRKLGRAIRSAKHAGLTVEANFCEDREPIITRRL